MSILSYLFLGALAATLMTLLFGLFTFLKGHTLSKKYSNTAMQARVIFQGLALLIFALLLWLGK